MRVIVFGATGNTGSALVERALAEGHTVTAFVRDPNKIKTQNERLSVVQGDALNADDVNRAVVGHDAILSALGAGTLEPTTVLSQMVNNLLSAAKANGIKRVVVTTSVGVFYDQPDPRFANIVIEHKRNVEALRTSGLEWVAVCPPYIIDAPRTGAYRTGLGNPPENANTITRWDLADLILASATTDQYLNQLVGVAN
jgi:putative NADH-flavin reductase